MLGHELWRYFHSRHETWVTLRCSLEAFRAHSVFDARHVYESIDAEDWRQVVGVIREVKPDVVLNCIGIIKQLKESKSAIPSITINALLPHQLAQACAAAGSRLVLFSTDCVFSGRKGGYIEADVADAEDLYGRTKFLGEVADQGHVITLRSSIIGRELRTGHSLIEWFLAQKGRKISGFRRAVFSGLTTIEMGRTVDFVLHQQPALHGLWHVASAPISKYDLLCLVRDRFKVPVEIEPDDTFCCDRSLRADRFNHATGYEPPTWDHMIEELAARERNSTS